MRISFFYTPKPRKFSYKPRFYNPDEEEFENLKKKYESANVESDETVKNILGKYKTDAEPPAKDENESFFGKKKIRKFNYQPRLYPTEEAVEQISLPNETEKDGMHSPIKMKRSKFYDDRLFAKPITLNSIIIFGAVTLLLLLWIFL